jgi:hypothetical protein
LKASNAITLKRFVFFSLALTGILATALFACSDSSQTPPPNRGIETTAKSPSKYPTPLLATADDQIDPHKFTFSLGDDRYIILSDGKGKRTRLGSDTEEFEVDSDEGVIERIYYFKHNDDLFLTLGLSDVESGWGSVMRLDGKTLKPKWSTRLPGFNVGQGLVEDEFLYVTTIGFVAKLDMVSGKYIWKHDGLYKPGIISSAGFHGPGFFNDFEQPKLEGDVVIFSESKPYTEHKETARPAVTLRFDKITGKRLGN